MSRLSQSLLQVLRLPGYYLRTHPTFPSSSPPAPPLQHSRTLPTLLRTHNSPPQLPPSTCFSSPTLTSTPPCRRFSVTETEDIVIPPPPTNCCMSGCANCVWITYAQELAAIYRDGDQASEKVMNAIEDPSLKIFLNLELKDLLKDSESENH